MCNLCCGKGLVVSSTFTSVAIYLCYRRFLYLPLTDGFKLYRDQNKLLECCLAYSSAFLMHVVCTSEMSVNFCTRQRITSQNMALLSVAAMNLKQLSNITYMLLAHSGNCLWSSGQSSWLLTLRSQV
jgi:hypothetical protein